jgi:hypothetical protein
MNNIYKNDSLCQQNVFTNTVIKRRYRQHIAPLEEHCHNSKNTTFQERGKPTGRGDAIVSKEKRHFSPLAAILENKRVTLFH